MNCPRVPALSPFPPACVKASRIRRLCGTRVAVPACTDGVFAAQARSLSRIEEENTDGDTDEHQHNSCDEDKGHGSKGLAALLHLLPSLLCSVVFSTARRAKSKVRSHFRLAYRTGLHQRCAALPAVPGGAVVVESAVGALPLDDCETPAVIGYQGRSTTMLAAPLVPGDLFKVWATALWTGQRLHFAHLELIPSPSRRRGQRAQPTCSLPP